MGLGTDFQAWRKNAECAAWQSFQRSYEEMALLGDVMEWGSGYGYGHDMGCK